MEHLIDSEEPASRFFPVSHVGPFIPLVLHCLLMKSQKAVKHLPCCWQSTSSNLAIIDGRDLVEDPIAGLSSLLDLKFIDELDRKKELMIEYLLLFIAQ